MRITDLYIYPVKSLQGIHLTHSSLSVTGLPWDRHWMLVDGNGRFVTQRQLPKMATIATALDDECLTLRCGEACLTLPLEQAQADLTPVRVWDSECQARDEGAVASAWFTQILGEFRGAPLRLVRFNRAQPRHIKAKYLHADEESHTEFADGFPFLIASQQSLDSLNAALVQAGDTPVGMERFRANIVVDAFTAPFDELFEHNLRHSDYQLAIRKPCERCPITTLDQITGERPNAKQPLRSLMTLNPLEKRGAYFGGNAILTGGVGANIRVGDLLECEPVQD
ncbi:MOSC domain-containing protein [Ferrimonas pelagia]|uniref:MOSC N-terminal beta barrel domain-containing protein n=1 Tax=Ferrimonas pelagia TaxID=1177826 RepID=A0ABP9F726_9GAMM